MIAEAAGARRRAGDAKRWCGSKASARLFKNGVDRAYRRRSRRATRRVPVAARAFGLRQVDDPAAALRLDLGVGRRIRWLRPNHELGFVFQEPTLMPWSNVFDNVWLPLRLAGASRAAARAAHRGDARQGRPLRVRQVLPARTLGRHEDARLDRPRAGHAAAVLLMDEPFAALDEITRTKLNDDLVALKFELGATVVFVTHSVYESVYLSDRIVVMAPRPGRVVAEVNVPSPLPRDEDFRLGAVYADACRATSLALHRAMGWRGEAPSVVNTGACRQYRPVPPIALLGALAALGGDRPHQPHPAGDPALAEPDRRDADQGLAHARRLARSHAVDHARGAGRRDDRRRRCSRWRSRNGGRSSARSSRSPSSCR